MSTAELATSYAALILADDGVDITVNHPLPPNNQPTNLPYILQADKLNSLITAAKVPEVEPIWCSLFAKALEGKDVKDLLMNVGSGGGAAAAPAAGGAAAGGAAAAEEAPKEEEKEEGELISILLIPMLPILVAIPSLVDGEFGAVGAWLVLTRLCVQRRRSRTRIWALVFSTNRVTVRSEWRQKGGTRPGWNCILRWRIQLVS
jgi:large subunit ribosomal protein LP1